MDWIMVTGGAGFIGSHLVGSLLQKGKKILCLDNFDDFYDPSVKRENIKDFINNQNFSLFQVDIRQKEKLNEIFTSFKIETVVHLAAKAGVRPSILNPGIYTSVNVDGTETLLEKCTEYNIKKFIFGSSSSVYGNNRKIPFSESDPVENPISPYAATKRAGELLCYTFFHLYRMPVVVMRFFTVYGPRQRPEMAIHKFTRLMLDGEPIPVYGDGKTSRDYTYIDDIVNGVERAVELDCGYEIINLGNSKVVQLIELIKIIERYLGVKSKIRWLPEQPGDVKRTYADIAKAVKLLGYAPETPISQGIERFVDWYKNALLD